MRRALRTLVELVWLGAVVAAGAEEPGPSALFPAPGFDRNGDGQIQPDELEEIHRLVPQFVLVTVDDNGHVDGMEWLENAGRRHGFWGHTTWFITGDYAPGRRSYQGGPVVATWQRLAESNPVGLHTTRHALGGTTWPTTRWFEEQQTCQDVLTEQLYPPASGGWEGYVWGSRAPFLAYDDGYFEALGRLRYPARYDSSMDAWDAGPEEIPPFLRVPWPFRLDRGIPPGIQLAPIPPLCVERVQITARPRIWEVPCQQYAWKGETTSSYDVNVISEAGFALPPGSPEAREMFRRNLEAAYRGNRAPFHVGLHAFTFREGREEERALYEWLFQTVAQRRASGEDWRYVNMVELVGWMQDEEPPRVEVLGPGEVAWRDAPRQVRARVTDATGVAGVRVRWRRGTEREWQEVPLSRGPADVWEGDLPREALSGEVVEMDLLAEDTRRNRRVVPADRPFRLRVVPRDAAGPRVRVTPLELQAVGREVILDALGSWDAESGVARVLWDLDLAQDSDGDGDPARDRDAEGYSVTLAQGLATPGSRAVGCEVLDRAGNGAAATAVIVADRWEWQGDFQREWTVGTSGPSADRMVARARSDLLLSTGGAWWFGRGTQAHATVKLPDAVGRLVVEYEARLTPCAQLTLEAGSWRTYLSEGQRRREFHLGEVEGAEELTLRLELVTQVEEQDPSCVRLLRVTAYPRSEQDAGGGGVAR